MKKRKEEKRKRGVVMGELMWVISRMLGMAVVSAGMFVGDEIKKELEKQFKRV